jgi:hypothetical protein
MTTKNDEKMPDWYPTPEEQLLRFAIDTLNELGIKPGDIGNQVIVVQSPVSFH